MKTLTNKERAVFATQKAQCNWYDVPEKILHPVYWEMLENNKGDSYIKIMDTEGRTYYSARKSIYETFLKIADYMDDDPDFNVKLELFTSKKGFNCARVILV